MKLDKTTQRWKSIPLLVRIGMFGLSSHRQAKYLEYFSVIMGLHGLIFFYYLTPLANFSTLLFFFGAYWISSACRYIDNHHLWQYQKECIEVK